MPDRGDDDTDAAVRVAQLEAELAVLRREHDGLLRLVDAMPVGLAVSRMSDGSLSYVNEAGARMMGISRDSLVERNTPDLYESGVRERLMEEVRTRGRVRGTEVWIRTKEGTRRRVLMSLEPLTWPEGTFLMGTGIDVTEAYEARAHFETVATHASTAIGISRESDDCILYANPALAELLGLPPDELIGLPTTAFVVDPPQRKPLGDDFTREGRLHGREILLRNATTGRQFLGSFDAQAVTLDGEACRMVTITDVTAQREAELELRRALAQSEVLLREIHHRVKNNLQVISSLLYLQGSRLGDPSVADVLDQARNRVSTMASIHEALYGGTDLSRLRFDRFLERLASHVRTTWGSRHDDVALEVRVHPAELELDRALPVGLIANELLSNAFKHAFPDGRGRVWLALAPEGDDWCLSVRDNGPGLRRSPDEGDDGLGMQLVRALTEQVDGTLDVVSDEGGTCLTLRFADRGEEVVPG